MKRKTLCTISQNEDGSYVFAEAEKVRVADGANGCCSTIAGRSHVQDGDLAEVGSSSQCRQHCASIVCHDLQLSPIHDEHLFPDLALATDVVRRREEDGLESQHEGTQEACFCVLEDLHPLQRVQVHMDRDLRLQFGCQNRTSNH